MIKRPQTIWKSGSLALLLFALFSLLVLLPLSQFFASSLLADGLAVTRDTLRDSRLQHALLQTLAVALLACGLASVIAIPAAFLAVRLSAPLRILIQILGFLPLTMPAFLSAAVLRHYAEAFGISMIAIPFEELGLRGNEIALILVFALHYLPFILFSLIIALQRSDRSANESARNLGAGRWLVWRRITLPLLTPAYALGASLMVLRILEDIGTPLILGIDGMLAPQILLSLGDSGISDPQLKTAALILTVVSVMVATLAWSALSQIPGPQAPGVCAQPLRWRPGIGPLLIGLPLTLGLGILALAPHVWLVLMSLTADWQVGALPETYDSGRLLQALAAALGELDVTSVYMIATGILTMLLGAAFAGLTRQSGLAAHMARFLTRSLFAIPGVVLALAFAHALTLPGLRESAWPGMAWLALALVVALKQLPLAERIIASRLQGLHDGARQSALNLGTGRLELGLRISLPALSTMLIAAFLIGSIAAAVELSAALLLLQETPVPLVANLFHSLRAPADPAGPAAQGLLLVSLTACLLLLLFWMLRQNCHRTTATPGGPPAVNRKSP